MKDIVEKIAAMLRLAKNDAAAEGEVRNALAFAHKLMAQHDLTEDDIPLDAGVIKDRLSDREQGETTYDTGTQNLMKWEGVLATFVAEFVGVGVYQTQPTPSDPDNPRSRKVRPFVFYGLKQECSLARELMDELRMVAVAVCQIRGWSSYRNTGKSYCMGFASGLHRWLKEQRVAEKQSPGTALVLMQDVIAQKQQIAKTYISQRGLRLKSTKTKITGHHDPRAYNQGVEDGKAYNPSGKRKVESGKPRQLTSA